MADSKQSICSPELTSTTMKNEEEETDDKGSIKSEESVNLKRQVSYLNMELYGMSLSQHTDSLSLTKLMLHL